MALRWLRRRILLAVPYCTLWRPCIQIDGWEFVLWPSWRVGHYDVLWAIFQDGAVVVSKTPQRVWRQLFSPVEAMDDEDED